MRAMNFFSTFNILLLSISLLTCSLVSPIITAEPFYNISTLVGGGSSNGDGLRCEQALLYNPVALYYSTMTDHLYVSDSYSNEIRKISMKNRIISTLKTDLSSPGGVAISSGSGDVYIANTDGNKILKVSSSSGITTTIAGLGPPGYNGDNQPAINAQLNRPTGLILSEDEKTLYINDSGNNRIRTINLLNGEISSVNSYPLGTANNGDSYIAGVNGIQKVNPNDPGSFTTIVPNTANIPYFPNLAFDSSTSTFYYSIPDSHIVNRIYSNGTISKFAGTLDEPQFKGDGELAVNAFLNQPQGIIVIDGNVYICDSGNGRVRKVDSDSGIITTFAGVGEEEFGNGVASNLAYFNILNNGIAETEDSFYFVQAGERVKKMDKVSGMVTNVKLSPPTDVFQHISSFGNNVYLSSLDTNLIYKLERNGSLIVHAGFSGTFRDARPAFGAPIAVTDMVIDSNGENIFFTDNVQYVVRKISIGSGIMTTVAGIGTQGFNGDDRLATTASLTNSQAISINSIGEIFISDNFRLRKILLNGTIVTIAGNGTFGISGDNQLATTVSLSEIFGIATKSDSIIFSVQNRVRSVNLSNGYITTIAGNKDSWVYNGDHQLAVHANLNPSRVTTSSSGEIYISEGSYRIRKILLNGTIVTIAGRGVAGYNGDNILAVQADVDPNGLVVNSTGGGEVYFSDRGSYRIRKIDSKGIITSILGNGIIGDSGDGQLALKAQAHSPGAIQIHPKSNEIYFSDNNRIRKIDSNGIVSTIAGGNGGLAKYAKLNLVGASFTPSGDMLIIEKSSIRKVSSQTGIISTIAGTGQDGYNGESLQATNSQLNKPSFAIQVSNGDIFIADTINHRIRLVSNSIMTTIAGTGTPGYNGDNIPAVNAQLNSPRGLAIMSNGEILIADSENHRIRKISTSGIITTLAGNGQAARNVSENVLSYETSLNNPKSILVSSISGEILIVEDNRIRKLTNVGYQCFGLIGSNGCSGRGNCTDYNTCSCQNGYGGSKCETNLLSNDSNMNNLTIILAIVIPVIVIGIIVAVVVIVVIILLVLHKKKARKQRNDDSIPTVALYQNEKSGAIIELENSMSDFPSDASLFFKSLSLSSISNSSKESSSSLDPLSRYSKLERIGQGGFGSIFKAFDSQTKTWKALKIIKYTDIDELNGFMKEGSQLMNVNHPHILKVNDFFIGKDQLLCIDTDFYELGDLAKLTVTNFECSEKLLKQIIQQTCQALSYIHSSMNIVHRDIKPSNIFIQSLNGDKIHVIIADFGLAKSAMSSANQSYAGTPLYMSPELGFGGKYYHNTDVYSLGVTLYQIMTKDTQTSISQLYVSKDQAAVVEIIRKKMQDANLYSEEVINIVLSMLCKDNLSRPQAQDILANL